MRIVIINGSSRNRFTSLDILKDYTDKDEVILITQLKYVQDFEEDFSKVIGLENLDSDDLLYYYIYKLNLEKKIDRIIATNEFDILRAGELRTFLEVTGQDVTSATSYRDKVAMKDIVSKHISTPIYVEIKGPIDVIKFKNKMGYPFIIKPRDGAGSMGVSIIKSDDDLERLFKKGITNKLMAESFVEGEMYHIDGIYKDGKLLLSQPSKYVNGCLAFQEEKYLGSVMLDKSSNLYERLNQAVKKVLVALPSPKHAIIFHAEFFHTLDDEIIFCEIASRVGGGMILEAIEYTKGINLLSEDIMAQIGINRNYNFKESAELTGWVIIPPKKGTLLSVNLNFPFEWVVNSYFKIENIGKEFKERSSSVDSVAMLLVRGEDEKTILERLDIIYKWFEENMEWDLEKKIEDQYAKS